jgi:hypothetical protein
MRERLGLPSYLRIFRIFHCKQAMQYNLPSDLYPNKLNSTVWLLMILLYRPGSVSLCSVGTTRSTLSGVEQPNIDGSSLFSVLQIHLCAKITSSALTILVNMLSNRSSVSCRAQPGGCATESTLPTHRLRLKASLIIREETTEVQPGKTSPLSFSFEYC